MANISDYYKIVGIFIRSKKHLLQGDRKYLTFVFVLIFTLLALGIISPLLIEYKKNNWSSTVENKKQYIRNNCIALFKEKEESLLNKVDDFVEILKEESSESAELKVSHKNGANGNENGDSIQEGQISIWKEFEFENYSFELLDKSGKLVLWSRQFITENLLDSLKKRQYKETFFLDNPVRSYLVCKVDVKLRNSNNKEETYKLFFAEQLEKKYSLLNNQHRSVSFSKELTDYFGTDIQIYYGEDESTPVDGRFFSFQIKNKKNKTIAIVNAAVPTLNSSLNSFKEVVLNVQTAIIIIAFLLLVLGLRTDFKSIKYPSVKVLLFLIFVVLLRVLLLYLNIPGKLLWEGLSNPSYFSSTLGGGIVKSPIELFVSSILFLVFVIYLFNNSASFKMVNLDKISQIANSSKINISNYIYIFLIVLTVFINFSILRSLAASVKSIIFDSSIEYFSEADIIPDFINLFINSSVLVLVSGFVIAIVVINNLGLKIIKENEEIHKAIVTYVQKITKRELFVKNTPTLLLISLYIIGSLLYIIIQNEPLITFPLLLIVLILLFFLTVRVNSIRKSPISNYVILTIISSVIGIMLMNHFNEIREKESFTVIANELNRKNENLLNFLTVEALIESRNAEELPIYMKSGMTDFNALAFRIWVNAAMSKENLLSSVSILNKKKKIIGSFSNGIPMEQRVPQLLEVMPVTELKTIELPYPSAVNEQDKSKRDFIVGIVPIEEKSRVLGYISVSILRSDENDFSSVFLRAARNSEPVGMQVFANREKKFSEIQGLSIFEIVNGKGKIIKSDFNLSGHFVSKISKAQYNSEGKAWFNFQIYGSGYIVYAVKSTYENEERIVVVAQKDKEYVWNLFNFFKLFSIHALLILFIGLFLILERVYRNSKISLFSYSNISKIRKVDFRSIISNKKGMSFKSQLLISFLIISLIPLIALAIYNRQNVAVKGDKLIETALRENSDMVKKHIRTQLKNNPGRDILTAAEKAKNELGLFFTIYQGSKMVYTTNSDLRKATVISDIINPQAYNSLVFKGVNEEVINDSFEGISYKTYVNRTKISNSIYFIEVNNLFNVIHNPFSAIEIDVFLFGTYSLGIILIIFISTLLANKISSPIRKLTIATKAVAMGDLSMKIDQTEQGELKNLIDGFNYMTEEIKKNQEELAEVEREIAWREMAKQVAHEIKNPLTPMKLNVQQLIASYGDKAKNFDSLFDKVTKIILQQIDTLSQIASEFSRFARMPGLKLSKVNLKVVCGEIKNLFGEEKIDVCIVIKTENVEVEADDNNLRRMLINLIRNSIQASATKVVLELSDYDNIISISVSDNGNGIPIDIQGMIFNPHFSTKKTGMGLGLKLAKRFMESIGGSITLGKSDELGTEFIMKFRTYD